jgi:hypothetical protein
VLALTGNARLAIGAGIVGLILMAVILVRAGSGKASRLMDMNRDIFFWLNVFYLGLLLALAAMYMGNFYGVKDRIPVILGGLLPLGVPWFGAVGAVVISFEGLFQHTQKRDWSNLFTYWHLARPLFGAVLGILAFFIFLLLIDAAGQPPTFATPNGSSPASDLVIYYVVAFLVGYREETFRELVKRATDLVFIKTQPKAGEGLPEVTFEANGSAVQEINLGALAGGATTTVTVTVSNTGAGTLTAPVVTVSTEGAPAGGPFAKANDAISGAGDVTPGGSGTMDVTFSPPVGAPQSFTGRLTVSSAALSQPVSVPLSGTRK